MKIIRSSTQRSAYAARRASLAVDRLLEANSSADRNKASSWAKAWGMRAGLLASVGNILKRGI
jgi:hypothetical protein